MTSPEQFRDEFPVTQTWSYLNHAANAPYPQRTVAALKDWIDGATLPAHFYTPERASVTARAAERIAQLVGGRKEDVVWVASLADGMNLLAHGIEWKPGDNVLLMEGEFPSVVYPFMNLESLGVEARFVAKNADGRTDIALIEQALDDRTRAVALSHVEYADGFRNDLVALGELCAGRGVELFVDGTQSVAVQPINLNQTKVSAVVAHGYKWMMAGFGVGCVVFNEGVADRLKVTYAGRLSVKSDFQADGFALDFRDGAARFQTGGMNVLGITGAEASLSLVQEAGVDWIREHTLVLLDQLADGLQSSGYSVVSDLDPAHRSQILTFSSGDLKADEELVAGLDRANVAVTMRPKGVRVSPFFYNNAEDIEKLLEALPPR